MNNVIQIKRGSSHPGSILQPYEPGINISDDNRLYIGGPLTEGAASQAQEVKVGFAAGLVLDDNNYGTDFPSNPKEGQVFFQLLTE